MMKGHSILAHNLFLVGRIGDSWIGISAEQVEAVVPLNEVVPVPHAPAAVKGLVAIRSRLLTLIDTAVAIGRATSTQSSLMVIVSDGGHGYALTMEQVEDVVALGDLKPVSAILTGGWAGIATHMADHDGRAILIVEPSQLIAAANAPLATA